jgi:uncharacterized protein YecA (UPF0149 family)
MDAAKKVGPGLYINPKTRSLEFDVPELLSYFGYQDTPENRDIVTAMAIKAARVVWPEVNDHTVTTSDPEATNRTLQQYGISDVKIKRNARCPCGSGRKYKHCCLRNN